MNNSFFRDGNSFKEEFLKPLSESFDELFNEHFPQLYKDLNNLSVSLSSGTYPKVDIVDHPDKVVIISEIGGWAKDEISVFIDKNLLSIKGTKNNKNEIPPSFHTKYIRREIKRSSFLRSFTLGGKVDKAKITSNFQNGALTIEIPKKEVDPAEGIINVEIK